MGNRLVEAVALLAAAALTTMVTGGFSVLHLLAWTVFYATLWWPLRGRQSALACRLPGWLRRAPKPPARRMRT